MGNIVVSDVKSATRVMHILTLLRDHPLGLTLSEVSKLLEIPKSSAHELLHSMVHENYLKVRGNRYSLGLKVFEIGRAAARSSDLLQYARPTMKWIAQELNESVQLAALDGTEVVYLSKYQPRRDIRLESEVGARLPSYATALGKALLSTYSEEEIDEKFADYHFEKFTPRTITSLEQLKRELEGVRLTGFARDRGEYTEDIFCYARPIKDHNNRAVAAISVSMPKDSASYRDWLLTILSEGTNSLSEKVQAIS